MKAYREWLPAQRAMKQRVRSAAASTPNNIEDYYMTPYDLGYGPFVKFDHDFIGTEALEEMAKQAAAQESDVRLERRRCGESRSHRCSITGRYYKYIDLPLSNYTSASYDKLVGKGGKTVGMSMFSGYSYNERSMLSLGVVDPDVADRHRTHARLGRRRRRL